jgi:hypothetical protein
MYIKTSKGLGSFSESGGSSSVVAKMLAQLDPMVTKFVEQSSSLSAELKDLANDNWQIVKGKSTSFDPSNKILTIDPTLPVTEQLRWISNCAADVFIGLYGWYGVWHKHIKRFEYVRLNVNEVLVRQGARNFNEYLIWKQTQGKVTIKLYPRRHGGTYERIFDSWQKGVIHVGQAIQQMADAIGSEPPPTVGGKKAIGNYYQALAKRYEKEWDEKIGPSQEAERKRDEELKAKYPTYKLRQ